MSTEMQNDQNTDPNNDQNMEQPASGAIMPQTSVTDDPFSWVYETESGKTPKRLRILKTEQTPPGPVFYASLLGAGILLASLIAGGVIGARSGSSHKDLFTNGDENPLLTEAASEGGFFVDIEPSSEALSDDEAPYELLTEAQTEEATEDETESESRLTPYLTQAKDIVSLLSGQQKLSQLFFVSPEALVNQTSPITNTVTQVGQASMDAYDAFPVSGLLLSAANQEENSYINQFIQSFNILSHTTVGTDLLIAAPDSELSAIGALSGSSVDDSNLREHYAINMVIASSGSATETPVLTDTDNSVDAVWVPGGFLDNYKEGDTSQLTSKSSTWAEYNKSHADFEKLCLMLPDGILPAEDPQKVLAAVRNVNSLTGRVLFSCPLSRKAMEEADTTLADAALNAFLAGCDQIVITWDSADDIMAAPSSGILEAREALENALRDGTITWTEINARLTRVTALKLLLADSGAASAQ